MIITKKQFFAVFISLIIGCTYFTQSVYADTIGVSPSEVYVEIEQGDMHEQVLRLSRSGKNADYDMEFTISLGQDASYIQIPEINSITIPAGESSILYTFNIDALNLEPGEYNDEILYFYLVPPEPNPEIEIGLGVKMNITVNESKIPLFLKKINRIESFYVLLTSVVTLILAVLIGGYIIYKRKKH